MQLVSNALSCLPSIFSQTDTSQLSTNNDIGQFTEFLKTENAFTFCLQNKKKVKQILNSICLQNKKKVKQILNSIDENEQVKKLGPVIQNLTELAINHVLHSSLDSSFSEIDSFFSEVLNEQTLLTLIQKDKINFTIENWSKAKFKHLRPVDPTFQSMAALACKNAIQTILRIVPSIMEIILDMLKLVNQRESTTFFDQCQKWDIICKLALIPCYFFRESISLYGLTLKTFLCANLVFTGIWIFFAFYQRVLRPLPFHMPNMKNLDQSFENGQLPHISGEQSKENVDNLCSLLRGSNKILIVGRSGEGKTSIISRFMQLKAEGKLHKDFTHLHTYQLEVENIVTLKEYAHAEILKVPMEKIEDFQEKVLLFVDEVDQILQNQNAFNGFKTLVLSKNPRLKCVMITTLEEFERICTNKNIDESFLSRVRTMHIKEPKEVDAQIVHELFYRKGKAGGRHVPYTKEAVNQILTYALSNSPALKKIGYAKRVEKLIEYSYTESLRGFDSSPSKNEDVQNSIKGIEKLILLQQKVAETISSSIRIFANESNSVGTKKNKIQLLWGRFYAKDVIKSQLLQKTNELSGHVQLMVNSEMIDRVFKQLENEYDKRAFVSESWDSK
jgi:ATP-dependent Clp protease ATP-binding subunit ClpA